MRSFSAIFATESQGMGTDIIAEGEQQAAAKLAEAATILATSKGAMELRYLNSLQEIAGDRTNTIVFPFSMADVSKAVRGDKL